MVHEFLVVIGLLMLLSCEENVCDEPHCDNGNTRSAVAKRIHRNTSLDSHYCHFLSMDPTGSTDVGFLHSRTTSFCLGSMRDMNEENSDSKLAALRGRVAMTFFSEGYVLSLKRISNYLGSLPRLLVHC